jgi:RND family efflux transporter MFP subunit
MLVVRTLLALAIMMPVSVLAQDLSAVSERLKGLNFKGRVEGSARAQVANSVNGFLGGIHFSQGDYVEVGQVLFSLSQPVYELQLEAAHALLDKRQIELRAAKANAERVKKLESSGAANQVRLEEATDRLALARIAVTEARVAKDLRRLELSSAAIRAPISGYIDAPKHGLGTFLTTETGQPLAEIVQVDPALVSYAHPYDSLLDLHRASPARISDYLERFVVRITLPTGEVYQQHGKVFFSDTELDSDGNLTVWAEIPNPEKILIPGLPVSVSFELRE